MYQILLFKLSVMSLSMIIV